MGWSPRVQGSSHARHSSRLACGKGIAGDEGCVKVWDSAPETMVLGVDAPLDCTDDDAVLFMRSLFRIPAGNLSISRPHEGALFLVG